MSPLTALLLASLDMILALYASPDMEQIQRPQAFQQFILLIQWAGGRRVTPLQAENFQDTSILFLFLNVRMFVLSLLYLPAWKSSTMISYIFLDSSKRIALLYPVIRPIDTEHALLERKPRVARSTCFNEFVKSRSLLFCLVSHGSASNQPY